MSTIRSSLLAGAAFGLLAIASFAQAAAPAQPTTPAPTIDSNGDGKPDAWDRNGDGRADVWDRDGDGKPDAADDDGDGKPDQDAPPVRSPDKPAEPAPPQGRN
jgi:hypothetical protein